MIVASIKQDATGYLHSGYAESLVDSGTPRSLPGSNGWILLRSIPHSSYQDAMGCYPIFACQKWQRLKADLDELAGDAVCLSLVADPFGDYDEAYLRECFPDLVMPFKQHFVIDLSRPADTFVHSHHRRNARKALNQFIVERCEYPGDFLDEWVELYQTLVERHNITGIAAFSRDSFARQFQVPGLVAFRAVRNDKTEGMVLWYVQANRGYYHLGAYSPIGYELRASFALFSAAIEYFAVLGLEWLNLGAGAGAGTGAESGLNRFKQGWSTGVRTAYFCGRIFDRDRYQEIVQSRRAQSTDYFPAYRAGEFS